VREESREQPTIRRIEIWLPGSASHDHDLRIFWLAFEKAGQCVLQAERPIDFIPQSGSLKRVPTTDILHRPNATNGMSAGKRNPRIMSGVVQRPFEKGHDILVGILGECEMDCLAVAVHGPHEHRADGKEAADAIDCAEPQILIRQTFMKLADKLENVEARSSHRVRLVPRM
jgi:hypothetical protein